MTAKMFAQEFDRRVREQVAGRCADTLTRYLRRRGYDVDNVDDEYMCGVVDFALRPAPSEAPTHVKQWERYSYWLRIQGRKYRRRRSG